MKNRILSIIIVLFAVFNTLSAKAQTIISLTSKGEIEVVPNIASTTVDIEKTNKNTELLQKQVLQISKDIQQKLKRLNIEKKDIQTSNIQMSKEYYWKNSTKIFKGYKARISTRITFRKIGDLEKIYTHLLSNKDVHVHGVQYDYSPKKALENKAYLKALKNANMLAEQLTRASGFSTKTIKSISNNGYKAPAPMHRQTKSLAFSREASMDTAPSITINTGTIKIIKNLIVVYHLE